MKMDVGRALALAATLASLPAVSGMAADARLGPASRVWLEGDSTLHAFTSASRDFRVELAVPPPAGAARTLGAGIEAEAPATMKVTIPVASLKSDSGGLDKNLRKALRADKDPDIVFVLKEYRLEKSSAAASVIARGALSIAGRILDRTIEARLSTQDGRVVLDGEHPLLMTEFGIKPPTMMLGAVKTQDRIVVKFHLELEQAAEELNKEKR